MDLSKYTYVGTFESREAAMLFRHNNYRWCSIYTEDEDGKVKLWVKKP